MILTKDWNYIIIRELIFVAIINDTISDQFQSFNNG